MQAHSEILINIFYVLAEVFKNVLLLEQKYYL